MTTDLCRCQLLIQNTVYSKTLQWSLILLIGHVGRLGECEENVKDLDYRVDILETKKG